MSIVLAIMTLFLLLFFHSNNITNIAKESLNLLVELEDNLPESQIKYLQDFLKNKEGVLAPSVTFVSKAEAMEIMAKDIIKLDSTLTNPFKDIIKFNIKKEFYSEKYIDQIKKTIELEKGVIGFYHENDSISTLKSNLNKISFAILSIALIFVVLAIAIIFNTIRLTLHSDQKLIKTMQMVGAEKTFIKKPYLRDAFRMALKSFLIVFMLIVVSIFFLKANGGIFASIISLPFVALTAIIALTIAVVIQLWATNFVLTRYLNQDF
jgi:cell division transport system permease protein